MQLSIHKPAVLLYKEPVTIKCNVHGKNLMAEIFGEVNHPIHYCFKVRYSDGVEILITVLENGYLWLEDMTFQPYALAIEKGLDDFHSVKNSQWFKFEISNNGKELLVWVAERDENSAVYSVHFDGDYQFTLRKSENSWEFKSIRVVNPNPIDQTIVDKVIKKLEERI